MVVTFTPGAVSGPAFVTDTVYVTVPPTETTPTETTGGGQGTGNGGPPDTTGNGQGAGTGPTETTPEGGSNGGRPPLSGQAATQIWILDLTKAADDPDRLEQVTFSPASEGPSTGATWSPDGTMLAFTRGSGQKAHIVVLDLTKEWGTDGRETTVSTGRHFGDPSWSPTDPDLVAVTRRGEPDPRPPLGA